MQPQFLSIRPKKTVIANSSRSQDGMNALGSPTWLTYINTSLSSLDTSLFLLFRSFWWEYTKSAVRVKAQSRNSTEQRPLSSQKSKFWFSTNLLDTRYTDLPIISIEWNNHGWFRLESSEAILVPCLSTVGESWGANRGVAATRSKPEILAPYRELGYRFDLGSEFSGLLIAYKHTSKVCYPSHGSPPDFQKTTGRCLEQ